MKTFIIAEAGVNHNGSVSLAKQLIDAAVTARADAVKFQTFKAEKLLTRAAPKAEYQTQTTGAAESQFDMIKKLELSEADHILLAEYCHKKSIQFMSTPFDVESVDFLSQTLKMNTIKIPSGEITNSLLLLKAARTNKPIILSTGMSTLGEIETALSVLAFGFTYDERCKPSQENFIESYRSDIGQKRLQQLVTLLHCTTEYPAPCAEVNLKAIDTMRAAFHLPVGYSDHTQGITIAIAAVARGATIIEKHFTLDRSMPGPDHNASLEPRELNAMVSAIRDVEASLGDGYKIPAQSEFKNRIVARRSLVALQPIRQGEAFTEQNLGLKRPGSGISGTHFWDWVGKTAVRDYNENELINE